MIAGKTWREVRMIGLAFILILEMLAIPVLLLWPDIYAELQRSTLLSNLGVDWLKRLGSGISKHNEEVAYINWCAVMLFFRSCNLVGTATAVLVGTGLFAREREANTFEFLLARPTSRSSLLWQKFWPCAIVVTVPIFIVNASVLPLTWSLELDLPKWELFLASVHAAIFALAFLTLTMYVSIIVHVQAHVAAIVGAFAVLQIGIYLTQRIRPYSLFRLVDFDWYGPILTGNIPAWQMFDPIRGPGFTTYLLAGTVVLYILSFCAIQRTEP
ncbi:MAG: ABC-type transport system involved in multi-copper enzyme maturation permease subunit [Planctomycetota bacterium]|jgi:ABC-type transport system involved in multi-copper enzyme maturation permease subunit